MDDVIRIENISQLNQSMGQAEPRHLLITIVDFSKVDFQQIGSVKVSTIELLLNYCNRYYDRQFITRAASNKDVISEFESLLYSYFDSEDLQTRGFPSVKYFAEQLHLSPNYLSDLLKKETGRNSSEHIQHHVVELAKDRLLSSTVTVSEIAYDLGFEYPQYFSKLFKKRTGMSPAEYRNLN